MCKWEIKQGLYFWLEGLKFYTTLWGPALLYLLTPLAGFLLFPKTEILSLNLQAPLLAPLEDLLKLRFLGLSPRVSAGKV